MLTLPLSENEALEMRDLNVLFFCPKATVSTLLAHNCILNDSSNFKDCNEFCWVCKLAVVAETYLEGFEKRLRPKYHFMIGARTLDLGTYLTAFRNPWGAGCTFSFHTSICPDCLKDLLHKKLHQQQKLGNFLNIILGPSARQPFKWINGCTIPKWPPWWLGSPVRYLLNC